MDVVRINYWSYGELNESGATISGGFTAFISTDSSSTSFGEWDTFAEMKDDINKDTLVGLLLKLDEEFLEAAKNAGGLYFNRAWIGYDDLKWPELCE